jgi:integral membrane protein (TIGR01906 family)
MKVLSMVTKVLLILAIPAFLFSLSIGIAVNIQWLYEAGFVKYNIPQVTGITTPELDKAAAGIIDYFNNGDEYINVHIIKDGKPYQLFSEDQKEIIHMRDVKALFQLDYKVLLGSFALIVACLGFLFARKNRRVLYWGLIGGGALTLGIIVVLGIGVLTGFFDTLFIKFHEIAFTNTDWLLDPNIDVLIQMFPDGFWQDAVSFIGLLAASASIVIGIIGGWLLWRQNRKAKFKYE